MSPYLEVVLRHALAGVPVAADFDVIERPALRAPAPGELLLRVIALSLDPYIGPRLRGRHMGEAAPTPGQPLPGFTVSQVMGSAHAGFRAGDFVVAETGWAQQALVPGARARQVDPAYPLSAHVGVLGMPGLTAWAGVTQLARVRAGDIFSVDAAAGPVGGTAGQIARNLGARTVGIAGGAAKCALVRERYGLDACVDYREDDWATAFKAATGAGPTVHYENVGLSVYGKVFPLLQNYARVVLCGLAEHYGSDGPPVSYPLGAIVGKRASVMGLVVYDFYPRLAEWVALGGPWLLEGRLALVEDASEGVASAPAQFERMLQGQHLGKALVRIGPDRV
jgi:hypothetical protein